MDSAAPAQGQVYLSGGLKWLVASRLLPRPVLRFLARAFAGVTRRRIRTSDRVEAEAVPLPPAATPSVLYFADIYHGGVTFWDWVVLRGGGLWWAVLWPLVIRSAVERLRAHTELRTVLELDAQTYEELEHRRHPDAEALRQVVALGRMEIGNGTYAQPLAQTIGAEANLRHFALGLTTIERVLGATVKSFVAGEPQFFPQLPQVLVGFGIENVVFRTHWAPFGTDPVSDHEIVLWRGPDGSTVRTVPRYSCMDYRLALEGHPGVQNAGLTGDDFEQWSAERKEQFIAEAARRGIRRPFVTRLADPKPPESPFPRVFAAARHTGSRLVTIKEYCDLPRDAAPLVTYAVDDMPNTIPWGLAAEQLHREQARAESALLVAERLDAIVSTPGALGQHERLDAAWKLLLRSQHHDLHLCGPWHSTSHGVSMSQVGCNLAARSRAQAEAVTTAALGTLTARFRPATVAGQAFLLFNPSPWPRREFVQLPAADGTAQVWRRGTQLVSQQLSDGNGAAVGFIVNLPPLGVDIVEIRRGSSTSAAIGKPVEREPTDDVLGRELRPIGLHGAALAVWKNGQLHRSILERVRCEADGPVLRHFHIDGRVADLAFTQSLTVIPELNRIRLVTEIDFGNGHHLGPQLADHRADVAYYIQDEKKLCLEFASRLPLVYCDSPFLLARPQGERMTGFSFVGLEAPEGGGAAILHQGTPGWHVDRDAGVLKNVLAWAPERWLYASDDSITPGSSRYTAIRGRQRFEHAVVAAARPLDALRAAHDFRLPVLTVGVPAGGGGRNAPWSLLALEPEAVILTALFARDGEAYARVWNASDEQVTVGLHGRHSSGEAVSFRLTAEEAATWPSLRPWGIQTVRLT